MRHKNAVNNRRIKMHVLGITWFIIVTFSLSTLTAQETINATGGEAFGSGGSVSYSVGQVFYQTHSGTSGSVTEGVQQPYEISVATTIEIAKEINLSVSAYPNPTTDYLILAINDSDNTSFSYQLFDIQGKLLQSEKITGSQTSIDMSNLVTATYFVKVYAVGRNDRTGVIQDNKEVYQVKSNEVGAKQFNVVKTFKVIKN